MAIRERGNSWQVYWNNPYTGRRQSKTFTTKEEAEKEDSLIKHRMKFERESFRPLEQPEAENKVITLEMAYIAYLKEKQFSRKGLEWSLDGMRVPLSMFGAYPLAEITKPMLQQVMDKHACANVKPVTVQKRMSVLRAFLRWAQEKEYCVCPQFPKLPPVVYEKLVPPTVQEICSILAVAPEHIKRIVIIGSQCGVRVGQSELLSLTWKDMDFERRTLLVHGSRKNPGCPWREVPVRENLLPVLEEWHLGDKKAGIEHIISYKGKPIRKFKRAWKSALLAAGITRRIRPYDLRHAFATELIAAGIDIGTVAKLMGHSSPAMLLSHYQYVMDSQKRNAVEALPELQYVPSAMCPTTKKG